MRDRRSRLRPPLRHGAAERVGHELRLAVGQRDPALNKGAAAGGFAHDTGEGGLSQYHLRYGADLVWEIGTGYFGCRTDDGGFDPEQFRDKAAHDEVQVRLAEAVAGRQAGARWRDAGRKVSAEIAARAGRARRPEGRLPALPLGISTRLASWSTLFARLRGLAGGKPTGFKLCVG